MNAAIQHGFCCICLKTTDDHIALFTVGKVTACFDHLRQAVAQSDGPQMSDADWLALCKGTMKAIREIEIEGFTDSGGEKHGD